MYERVLSFVLSASIMISVLPVLAENERQGVTSAKVSIWGRANALTTDVVKPDLPQV